MNATTEHNADPRNWRKFGELAHRWWDPHSEFKPLHDINPLRLGWIDRHCGLARQARARRRLRWRDCSAKAWRRWAPRSRASTCRTRRSASPACICSKAASTSTTARLRPKHLAAEQPGSFDVVTCLEMLEHVPDPASTVAACATLVKPGGQVFFSTINRNPKAYLFAVIGAEYILNLLPKGTHDYARFLRPAELARALPRKPVWRSYEIIGMSYNPLTRTYSLGQDTTVNYLMRARRDA